MSQFRKQMAKRAVALRYGDNDPAPIVVASGTGFVAEKMVEVANDNDVPVFEDTSLATVLSQLELGTAIPEELYKTVVDIYVFFLHFSPKQRMEDAALEEGIQTEKQE